MSTSSKSLLVRRDIVVKRFKNVEFSELIDDLTREIKQLNYRITRINNIDNIHDRKQLIGKSNFKFTHYKIVEICNLNNCAELISSELLAGVFMPVRFIVYQRKNARHISAAFLKPTAFAGLFSAEATPLNKIAKDIERDMFAILNELDY